MAGDTPEAGRLAGHLAECASCGAELRRIGRSSAIIRRVVRDQPAADLRDRTLAYVREVGRPRGPGVEADVVGAAARSTGTAVVLDDERRARRRRWWLPAGIAASVAGSAVLAAGIALTVVGADREATEQRYEDTVAALAKVNAWTLRIDGEDDAQRVALRADAGSGPTATLLFSPSTTELVVVATDLQEPPPGAEYRCWIEVDGKRDGVGKMFFGGGLAYWVGDVPSVARAADGTRFGISLVPLGGGADGAPVMVGEV
jgi:hypothetical protein